MEEALYLSKLCEKVYLIHRRDTLRADKAGELAIKRQENIIPVWNSAVAGLNGDPDTGKLASLTLRDTSFHRPGAEYPVGGRAVGPGQARVPGGG